MGGKGPPCALSKGFNGKMSSSDITFAQKVRGQQGKLVGVTWFLKIMGGGKCVVFGLHKRWVGKKVYGDG
jgi:hypothetical protein